MCRLRSCERPPFVMRYVVFRRVKDDLLHGERQHIGKYLIIKGLWNCQLWPQHCASAVCRMVPPRRGQGVTCTMPGGKRSGVNITFHVAAQLCSLSTCCVVSGRKVFFFGKLLANYLSANNPKSSFFSRKMLVVLHHIFFLIHHGK